MRGAVCEQAPRVFGSARCFFPWNITFGGSFEWIFLSMALMMKKEDVHSFIGGLRNIGFGDASLLYNGGQLKKERALQQQ